jgi:hypothetical protein
MKYRAVKLNTNEWKLQYKSLFRWKDIQIEYGVDGCATYLETILFKSHQEAVDYFLEMICEEDDINHRKKGRKQIVEIREL